MTIDGTNDAAIAVAGHTLNYTENQAATAIDPALTVSDVDSANLSSATVQITGNYVNGQDVLGFTNQNGITGSFNAATGTLTLTGSSSVANYQTALDSVTYLNTSDNPSGLARTVTIITNDGTANSLAATDTINVTPVNDAPVVSGLAVTETVISFVATDPDNATLSLSSPFGAAFGNPTINSGATTTLTPTTQVSAVSGSLQVTDGGATAAVVGLYLGTGGNDTATAPLATAPNAMYGFGGDDTLTGGTAADSIYGGANNDTIVGGGGADALIGDAGNDMITYETGATIHGDAGSAAVGTDSDTLVLNQAATIDLSQVTDQSIGDTSTVSGFENVDASGSSTAVTLTGSSGANTLKGGAGADTITGGAGADTLTGGGGNDTFNLANGDFAAGESIDGGGNTDSIVLTNTTTVDFTTGTVTGVETINGSSGNDTVTMSATQWAALTTIDLGAGTNILNVLASGDIHSFTTPTISNVTTGNLTGTAGDDSVTLTGSQLDAIIVGSGTINLGAGTGDTINLTSTSADLNTLGLTDSSIQGVEVISAATAAAGVSITLANQTEGFTITGSAFNDVISGGIGADTINAGGGNDTINLFTVTAFAAGESIDGGTGTDTNNSAVVTDFSVGTVTNVENLIGTASNDTITMTASQWAGFSTIDLGAGTNVLNVVASGGISALGSPAVSNVTTGNLTGTSSNDSVTLTGAQLDAIIVGTGTINLGTGTSDTINLTSTSADLNTLGTTDSAIQGVEAISAATAAAGVTITLGGQSEGVTITGSANADTITGGTGADAISAGRVNDTINLANGQFAAGESIDGGTQTTADSIVLTNATTVDFSTGTITGVETLSGSVGLIDQLTMSASQWAGFTTINLGAGSQNVLNVVASGDISALGTPAVSNITIGNLTGTAGTDSITLTGAQLDAIIQGAGVGISLGAGSGDTINLTSTSTDLNTLGDASITGVEAISASTAAAGVQILLGGQSESFTITGSASADTITGGTGADTIDGGGGADLIRGGAGNDSLTGGTGADQFRLQTNGNTDTITDFAVGTDKIGFLEGVGTGAVNYTTSGTPGGATPGASDFTTSSTIASMNNSNDNIITVITGAQTTTQITASTGSPGNHADNTYVVVFNSTTGKAEVWFDDNWNSTAGRLQIATLNGVTSGQVAALTAADFVLYDSAFPAGVAGSPIKLGLTDPTADPTDTITVMLAGVAPGWIVNGGTDLGNGSWTILTNVPSGLTITAAAGFAGASLIQVTESWTNDDGSTGSLSFGDNVEAYAPGSPIFALSGDDNLTGSSGHDMFVFSQPIGHDVIYSFDATSDQIDLIGYANFTGFGDIQAHMANDAAGNAVITLADGQSITLNGVDAASLTASDFVFDQTPVTENAGHMVISDGAILPLSGTIDNIGTIELNSTGSETDLELIEHGITLQGHGQVILSDSSENVITGTVSDVTLTNVDNTISGAGHIGDGVMVLVNEGTIIATGTNAFDLDTGSNAVTNNGTLEATGTGGLEVHSDLINTGVLWANGGNVTIDGNVSGNGTAQISGSATLEFGAASSANVALDAQATGTIVLHDSFDFSGVVSGFNGDDHLDLLDVAFGAGTTASYVANQVGTGGTLSVTDGVHTANIALLGQYDPTGFQTEADKNTGTLISYHDHLA